jgi:protein phosphatase 1B
MSIVLVVFPGAPTPTQEAIEAEKELDATLERRIKGCFNFFTCQGI